jgi:hypothetical protein
MEVLPKMTYPIANLIIPLGDRSDSFVVSSITEIIIPFTGKQGRGRLVPVAPGRRLKKRRSAAAGHALLARDEPSDEPSPPLTQFHKAATAPRRNVRASLITATCQAG